jgi:hypothetical protein
MTTTLSRMSAPVLVLSSSIGFGFVMALVAVVGLILLRQTPVQTTPPPAPPSESQTNVLESGKTYTISREGRWLRSVYEPEKPKGQQCDVTTVTSRDQASPFLFEKDGDAYIIKGDCDADGNWTSYMSEDGSDLLQIRERDDDKVKRQRWTVECLRDSGCTVQNNKNSKYLTLGPGVSSQRGRVTLTRIA